MINLKEQLHEGCTVHFRCGGSAVVESIIETLSGNQNITFKDNGGGVATYCEDGTRQLNQSLFDIVKIDPKPFDWKDAKQKMAFIGESGRYYYYVADDFAFDAAVIVCTEADCSNCHSILKCLLTRYPAGDLA